MFKKLLSKLFKKTKSNNANLFFFEDKNKALNTNKKPKAEQVTTNDTELVFRSFEEEYQQAFYDYLLGNSGSAESSTNDELSQFISEKVQSLLKNPKLILDTLPILPLSLSKIIDLLNSKDFEIDSLIQLIQQEPAIAAKVIELANSAYYNRNEKEIVDLKSAFMVLGVNGLSEGVINGFVSKLVPQSNIYFRQYGQKIWQHSLSTGVTAKAMVAKSQYKDSAAQAYFIGLICNLGDLIIYQLMIDAFSVVHPDCQPNSRLFKTLMAKESKRLTYFIAKYWNFPDSILEVLALQANVKRAALLPALHKKMPLACYVYEAKIISELEQRLAYVTVDDDYIKEVSTSLLFTQEANNQLKLLLADKMLENA
jgi:HD-like signal output (HDOD) protein